MDPTKTTVDPLEAGRWFPALALVGGLAKKLTSTPFGTTHTLARGCRERSSFRSRSLTTVCAFPCLRSINSERARRWAVRLAASFLGNDAVFSEYRRISSDSIFCQSITTGGGPGAL